MFRRTPLAVAALLAASLLVGAAAADTPAGSLKMGTPDLKSAGALTFGPEGILFIGDPQSGAIFAIDTGDRTPAPAGPFKIQALNEKIASSLGTDAKKILINDLAVNPASGNAFVAVARGTTSTAPAVLLKVTREGKISEVPLKDVKFAKAVLPNASSQKRQEAITGLTFVDGKVFVAGLSNEEFASNLRAIPFPFTDADKGTSVEIFHGAHGKLETASPVRTFAAYKINGQAHLLAAYTCTPLVKFPVSDLKPGEKIRGVTVAELGNRNRPLDMIVYEKGGKEYVLMANNNRGMMKIDTAGIEKIEGINKRISDKAGLTYVTIEALKGVEQLARQDKDHALVLNRTTSGTLDLETIELP